MSGPIANNPVYKTPCEHGGVFFAPQLRQMVPDLLENRRGGDDGPFAANRKTVRAELVDLARQWRTGQGLECPEFSGDMPLIATGHQAGFWHAGIFIKYLLADRLAGHVGGAVLNIIVDNDLPGQTVFQWPCQSGKTLECLAVDCLAGSSNVPVEYQQAVNSRELQKRLEPLTAWRHSDKRLAGVVEAMVDAVGGGGQTSLVDFFIRFTESFMTPMVGPRLDLPVSVMAESESFWRFFARIAEDAEAFVHTYNVALHRHRQQRGIRNSLEPVPDLTVAKDRIELPFWLFDPEKRSRSGLIASMEHGRIAGLGDVHGKRVAVAAWARDDWQALRQGIHDAGVAIRPRALTLTMFVRLFLADTFVHGIGGAIYDAVTDAIIEQYFQVCPPTMICTSATLRLDLGPYEPPEALDSLDRQRRALRRDRYFNPQRYLDKPDSDTARLLNERQEAIEQGRQLARTHGDPAERKRVFRAIRQCNAAIWERQKQWQQDDRQQQADIARRVYDSAIAHSREYFFGLFDRDDLDRLDRDMNFA